MKAILQRFLTLLKTLFMKLRVVVTLQLGHDKVNKENENSVNEDLTQKGD